MADAGINWGSVADWVSGLGSTSAAVVALYLAKASQRIRLEGYCGMRTVLQQGMPRVEVLSIVVTNVGTRATVISTISFRVGGFRKKRVGIITAVRDAYSVGIPFPLADGQQGHWGIPLGEGNQWLRDLADGFIKCEKDIRTLRFRVHTNHGEVLTLKPEDGLCEALRKILAEPKPAQPPGPAA